MKLTTLQPIYQQPWDPSSFIGFSQEQIALIKHGWEAALDAAYSTALSMSHDGEPADAGVIPQAGDLPQFDTDEPDHESIYA